jgi:multidrug resistance efflux pump
VEAAPNRTNPFRQEALRAQYDAPALQHLPTVQTSRWAALAFIASVFGVVGLVAALGRVELTTLAAGSLVVQNGPRPVAAQLTGVVRNLTLRAGDRVDAGQSIAQIEAEELRARVDKATRLVQALRAEQQEADRVSEQLQRSSVSALHRKRRLLEERAVLKEAQIARREPHANRMRLLVREGVNSEVDAMVAAEAASATREELLALRQEGAELGIQLAERDHRFEMEKLHRALEVQQAEVSLAEAEALVVLGELRAPVSGRLESLLVSEGQVTQAGTLVARIIPDGEIPKVVVFAPADDAAFLRTGTMGSLEFPSLPVSEFGKARAVVTRVGTDLALPAEVLDVLGTQPEPSGALVRVELTPKADATWAHMSPHLGSGARVLCRLETRKRRIAVLLFDFLRKWYPE